MTPYTRSSPSPRYRELMQLYRQLHEEGDPQNHAPAEKTFSGKSLGLQLHRIRALIAQYDAQTLLDYGCGKAGLYHQRPLKADKGLEFPSLAHYLGLPEQGITLYDPAYAPYMSLPQGTFDAVICTDVLEHCPEQDIPWILSELFAYAGKFVFANIACFPAKKNLPNGENAHCTIHPKAWWVERIAAAMRPGIQCYFWVGELMPDGKGGAYVQESLITSDPNHNSTARRFAV